jgi:hypothetical protein
MSPAGGGTTLIRALIMLLSPKGNILEPPGIQSNSPKLCCKEGYAKRFRNVGGGAVLRFLKFQDKFLANQFFKGLSLTFGTAHNHRVIYSITSEI